MSSEITRTPIEPRLIPDRPGLDATELATARSDKLPIVIGERKPKLKKRLQRTRNRKEKFTLKQAFDYFYETEPGSLGDLNLERAVRAAGFLLHWCSDMGNEPMSGNAANGLGYILEFAAEDFAHLKNSHRREVEALREVLKQATNRE